MDQELKTKWVEALRSGRYEQGRSQLKDGNCYCCLGVLCEVAGIKISKDGFTTPEGWHPDGYYPPIVSLIGVVRERALVALNDTEKKSFSEIADYIETNL